MAQRPRTQPRHRPIAADEVVEFVDDDSEQEPFPAGQLEQIHDAYLAASDWTTEVILSQLHRGNIDMRPSFQRRDAWRIGRKSLFIESVLLGFPIPQIVLAQAEGTRGSFIVLDGKQRLLALMQFAGVAEGDNNAFALRGLRVRADLNGSTFREIKESGARDLAQFYNHTIRTVVIRNWPSHDFLHELFLRLNTGSVQLSTQELRQAMFPGPFLEFLEDWTTKSKPLQALLRLKGPDFRMRDVEIAVRFLAFQTMASKYRGNLREFLDTACRTLNANWDQLEKTIHRLLDEFEEGLTTAAVVFGQDTVARKWQGHSYQSRFNRAVFDVQLYYFADQEIREASRKRASEVEAAFRKLCETDQSFVTSVEATTKSISATQDRFLLWGRTLRRATGVDFGFPQIAGD